MYSGKNLVTTYVHIHRRKPLTDALHPPLAVKEKEYGHQIRTYLTTQATHQFFASSTSRERERIWLPDTSISNDASYSMISSPPPLQQGAEESINQTVSYLVETITCQLQKM